MIRIAICDDNLENGIELSKLLEIFAERIQVEVKIVTYKNGKSLLFAWENPSKYSDILYLDIGMPEVDGIRVAESLREKGYKNEIIFFTRTDSQAIKAFDVDAFHYILKDATSTEKAEEIFRKAIRKAQNKAQEYISFSCAGENHNILINSISHFEVNGRVVTVFYDGKKRFDFYATLGKIEDALCDKGFIRINRTTLVSIRGIKTYTSQKVFMNNGDSYAIGRTYRSEVKEEISSWSNEVEV